MTEEADGFFEEDEPLADVVAAFESGVHGVTQRPLPEDDAEEEAAGDAE